MKKILYNLILPFAFVSALLSSIIYVSCNRSFYNWQYTKNQTAFLIGISHSDLMLVTDQLLDYMVDKAENLDMQYEVHGKKTEIFDPNEKQHMVDVQKLFVNVIHFNIAIILLILISSAYLIRKDGFKAFRYNLGKKYKFSAIVTSGICVILSIIFATNFNWFWTNFHYVFFSNDLWLLDPVVSIMINMFPLNFFTAMCSTILCLFIIICVIIYILLMNKIKLKKIGELWKI